MYLLPIKTAQSARVTEYADCIVAEGKTVSDEFPALNCIRW